MAITLLKFNCIKWPDKTSPYTKRRQYCAIIPEGKENITFKNKAKALAYQAVLNDFASVKLREMNRLTVELYAEYRRRCLRMNNMQIDKCATAFLIMDKQLIYVMRNSQRGDGYYYLVHHLKVWRNELNSVIEVLQEDKSLSADTEGRATLRIQSDHSNRILERVNKYPLELYYEKFTSPGSTPPDEDA